MSYAILRTFVYTLVFCTVAATASAQFLGRSGSGSPAYRFDEETGVFTPAPDRLGPLLAEGARTVGKGQFYLDLVYTREEIDEIDGIDIDEISDLLGFGGDAELVVESLEFVGEYGLTNRWDVSLILPIEFFTCDALCFDDSFERDDIDNSGFGDMSIRTKYLVYESTSALPDFAVEEQLVFPTGDEDKLLGSGEVTFVTTAIVSQTYFGWLSPHANFDFTLNTLSEGSDSRNGWNFAWILGTDLYPHERLSLHLSFAGLHLLDPQFDSLSGGGKSGDDLYAFAVGAKVDIYAGFRVFGAVSLPLNDDGNRSDVAFRVGSAYAF